MFSEQYGRKDNDMHKRRSKSKDDEKALRFDQLEDKLKAEMKDMSIKDKEKEKDGKAEMKYSSAVQIERVNALARGGKTKSANVILEKEKNLMASHRSSSLEKHDGESVSVGLFDAANVVCNIVDVSKDSTLRQHHQRHRSSPDASKQQKPVKKTSNASITSTSSHNSGPFASLKESERKKKQSVEDEEF